MNVQLESVIHDGRREVPVVRVLIRKARYRHDAGKYKTHAVNVVIWDPVRQEERAIEFSLFGESKEKPGPLGWLRWTPERMEIVRATAPKSVVVVIGPNRFNPAVPFFHLSRQSREDWCERIKNYMPDDELEPDPRTVAIDSAVAVVFQAWLPGLSEQFVVTR